ncbi:hypothetical protein ACFQ2B_39245 [Streptomyces stramineus]|uniref:Uncharacterized protein n=1 Tax=Streptomyces stramineus TaxID=173861 RepID=A0ABP3KHT9_9ACTN
MNELLFGTADTLIDLLGGPGNVLAVTYTLGDRCVKVAVAHPDAARPAELGAHPAVRDATMSACGIDLDVGPRNCPAFALTLLASANILPELT